MKQSAKNFLCSLLILCLMILCLLPPSAALAAGQTKYVYTENGKSLNVREIPGKNGSVIDHLPNGSKVAVVSDEGEWIRIDLNGRTGYVMAQFLVDSRPNNADAGWTKTSKTLYVDTGNSGRLHLRKDANRNSASLGLFSNGTVVQVSAVSDQWAQVSVCGQNGYMMLSCLSAKKIDAVRESSSAPSDRYVKGTGTVKMFTEASASSLVLLALPGGTKVKLYSETGKWSRITAHGQVGFVLTSFLTDSNPNVSTSKATVINPNGASYVNLRSSAALVGSENVLAHIKVNTKVDVLRRKKSWIMISCNGMVGYMHKSFLSFE